MKSDFERSQDPGVLTANPSTQTILLGSRPNVGNTAASDEAFTVGDLVALTQSNGSIIATLEFTPRGEYSLTESAYSRKDIVHYQGASYVCIIPNGTTITGNDNPSTGTGGPLPTDTGSWAFLVSDGDDGAAGATPGSLYTITATAATAAGQLNITGNTLTIHQTDGEGANLSTTVLAIANLPIGSILELINIANPVQRQQIITNSLFTGGPVITATVGTSGTAIATGANVRLSVRSKGNAGTDGTSSSTSIQSFTQPAVGASVTATVGSSSGLSLGVLYATGGNTYQLTEKPTATSVTLLNPSTHSGLQATAPGGTVPTGVLSSTGFRGTTGATGTAATLTIASTTTGEPGTNASFAETGASTAQNRIYDVTVPRGNTGADAIANNAGTFTQPAIDADVTVTVDSSAGIVSQAVTRHTSGNVYRVISVPSATSITIRNSTEFQGAGQSAASATVPAGTFVPSGERGLTGVSLGSLYTVSASAAASAGQINITGSTLTIHQTDGEANNLSTTFLSIPNLPIGTTLELVNQTNPSQRQQLRTTTVFTGGPVLTATVSSSGTTIASGVNVRVAVRAKGEVGAGGSITVTDGTTSVTGVTNIQFTKASSVTNLGGGVAQVNNDGGSGSLQGTSLTRLTVQSIPNDNVTFISFPAPGSDPLSAFNIANPTRLTAPATGWYLLSGFITLNSNVAITVFSIFFTKNGTDFTPQARVPVPSGGINPGFPLTDFQFLTAGDYIELGIYQNSGASKNTFDSSSLNPTFKMLRIG